MRWYLAALKKYITLRGRARRKEFWIYTLIDRLIQLIFMGIIVAFISLTPPDTPTRNGNLDNISAFGVMVSMVLFFIYLLATMLPTLAVTVRRLHDTDRSGWWIFIGLVPYVGIFILLVLLGLEGTKGNNRFGTDPIPAEEYEEY